MPQQPTGYSIVGIIFLFLMLCIPACWPFLLLFLIIGGATGRYSKPPTWRRW